MSKALRIFGAFEKKKGLLVSLPAYAIIWLPHVNNFVVLLVLIR